MVSMIQSTEVAPPPEAKSKNKAEGKPELDPTVPNNHPILKVFLKILSSACPTFILLYFSPPPQNSFNLWLIFLTKDFFLFSWTVLKILSGLLKEWLLKIYIRRSRPSIET